MPLTRWFWPHILAFGCTHTSVALLILWFGGAGGRAAAMFWRVCIRSRPTAVKDTIEAQVQGGTFFGLTAALYGAITLKNGRVEQGNFDTYRPLRIDEAPVVETHLAKSSQAPGGFGEAPTAVVAPAVTNAIFAATAKRIRTLPIDTNLLKFPS